MSTFDRSSSKDPTPEVPDPQDLSRLGFALGPLQAFDPSAFLSGDDAVDAFVLSMALAYNDLKSAQWVYYMLQKHPPPDPYAITADVGQWTGMRVHMTRWLMALAHEVIHAVNCAETNGVLKKRTIKTVIRTLPKSHRKLWDALVTTSTSQKGTGAALRPYLKKIRNEGVFHFAYADNLLKAYREYFLSDPKQPTNLQGYLSVGDTMAKTRFYFADAAAQRMYSGTEELQALFQQSEKFTDQLHHMLAAFVWGYLKSRVRAIHR